MGHYEDHYAKADDERHERWLQRVKEEEERIKTEIAKKGIARVLAERWTLR